MNMWNWLKNLFKKKPSLREQCVAAYGEEFVSERYILWRKNRKLGRDSVYCIRRQGIRKQYRRNC